MSANNAVYQSVILDMGTAFVFSHFRTRGSADQWVTDFHVWYGDDLDDTSDDPGIRNPANGQ